MKKILIGISFFVSVFSFANDFTNCKTVLNNQDKEASYGSYVELSYNYYGDLEDIILRMALDNGITICTDTDYKLTFRKVTFYTIGSADGVQEFYNEIQEKFSEK